MHAEQGFTLIEVLIALAIAVLALGAMYAVVAASINNTELSGKYAEAVSRARSHLAAIDQNTGSLAGSSEGDDGGGFRWKLLIKPLTSGPGSLTLYQVIVAVSWHQGKEMREVDLETRRLAAKPAAE